MTNAPNFQNNQVPFATGICIGSVTDTLLGGLSGNGQGLPISPYASYNIVPAAASPNNIALVQSVTSLTTLVLTPGAGVTLVTDPTSIYFGCLKLDIPRALQFVVAVGSGSPTVANININGFAGFGSYVRPQKEQITTTTTAGQIFYTNKTYQYISPNGITVSGGVGTGGTVSVGIADILGLPFFVGFTQDIVSVKWLTVLGTAAVTGATPVVVTPSGIPTTASVEGADIRVARLATIGTPGPFAVTASTFTNFTVTGTASDASVFEYTIDFSKNCQILVGDRSTPSLTTADPIGRIVLSTPSDNSTPIVVNQFLRQLDVHPENQSLTGYLGKAPFNG